MALGVHLLLGIGVLRCDVRELRYHSCGLDV